MTKSLFLKTYHIVLEILQARILLSLSHEYIYIYSIINCIKILRKFFKIVILVSKVSILSVSHFSTHTRGKIIVNRDTKFLFGTDSDVGLLHFLRLVSVQV